MKLGLLQLHITADIADNKTRLAEGIIDLAKRGAELIVLQELHNTLYFCQVEDVENFDLAEPIPGPSTEFYGKLAKDLGVVIVTSLFERRAPGLYHNTAVVIEKDGSIAGKYRKMHIPDFSGPSRTSRQRLSGSSKVFFRGLRPSRSSGPPGRASMTPRRVLLLSGAYRRTRVAGDPFFSHDRSDWMVGCGSKLDASLFSNVVQDFQHSIAILLFADVACGMQYPDHFMPFRPHASQIFLGGVSESHQHRLATE